MEDCNATKASPAAVVEEEQIEVQEVGDDFRNNDWNGLGEVQVHEFFVSEEDWPRWKIISRKRKIANPSWYDVEEPNEDEEYEEELDDDKEEEQIEEENEYEQEDDDDEEEDEIDDLGTLKSSSPRSRSTAKTKRTRKKKVDENDANYSPRLRKSANSTASSTRRLTPLRSSAKKRVSYADIDDEADQTDEEDIVYVSSSRLKKTKEMEFEKKGKENDDMACETAFKVLPKVAQHFLADCEINTVEQFLSMRTNRLGGMLLQWRDEKGMSKFEGAGETAIVTAWKEKLERNMETNEAQDSGDANQSEPKEKQKSNKSDSKGKLPLEYFRNNQRFSLMQTQLI